MTTILAPTYKNFNTHLTIGYHEIKVDSMILQSYSLASKYYEN